MNRGSNRINEAIDRYMEEAKHCDWCGKAFGPEERGVPGYENERTHERCQGAAVRAWANDRIYESGGPRDTVVGQDERMPFTDWPNGQGTYD